MNKNIGRRLDRLTERLLPDRPSRGWQIIIWSAEGPIKGPVITWRPAKPEQVKFADCTAALIAFQNHQREHGFWTAFPHHIPTRQKSSHTVA
jgi:hypothetical protein